MAPLIQPDVCRFAVNGTMGGRPVVNLFDMSLTTTGGDGSRDGAVADQAADLLHAFDDRILPLTCSDYVANSVSWVDLDSETGSTGLITSGGGDTWPKSGGVTGEPYPGNTSVLITKVAPGGGRRFRNGRTYWCGVPQTTDDAALVGTLTPANITAYTAAWEGFSSDVSNTVIGEGFSSNLVVLHTVNEGTPSNPDIVAVGYSEVTAMVCQARLATQRRRLRG